MKKPVSLMIAAFAGLLSISAQAGTKYSYPVSINTSTRTVTGSLGTARNSTSTVGFIGCTNFVSAGYKQMQCTAMDTNGKQAICYSSNADLVNMVSNIGSASYIYFTYDASANCTALSVSNMSWHEPMK